MTTETKNGYRVIKADEGYFLTNQDMTVYGYEIILGIYDAPENYRELPVAELPVVDEHAEPTFDEPHVPTFDEPAAEPNEPQEISPEEELAQAKASKLRNIDAYDRSQNVNGFKLNGVLMWLDRETRSSLRNTIESATLIGRTELDIWFGETRITLPLTDARMMLAVLEMYATDCYNVTAQHKAQVRNLDTLAEVEEFDITDGYPQMPEFGNVE